MYSFLKSRLKTLVSQDFLFKNEVIFRRVYGQFYRGTTHQCKVCNNKLRSFITLDNSDLLCPFCGSLSRNRRLWQYINENALLFGDVLHFSPSRCLFRVFKKNTEINYYSADYENEFLADFQIDITNISSAADSFDLIICYHILEHIVEDIKAMKELHRVLKPNGRLLIQTPFKEGNTYEDPSITSREERKMHFGQEDHVRIYSKKDLKTKLEETGFKVLQTDFERNESDFYKGLKSPETLFNCSIKIV